MWILVWGRASSASPMFNRRPGAMLLLGHKHQCGKDLDCNRVLSQHTPGPYPGVTDCSIQHRRGLGCSQARPWTDGDLANPSRTPRVTSSKRRSRTSILAHGWIHPGSPRPETLNPPPIGGVVNHSIAGANTVWRGKQFSLRDSHQLSVDGQNSLTDGNGPHCRNAVLQASNIADSHGLDQAHCLPLRGTGSLKRSQHRPLTCLTGSMSLLPG
jgi:hypothetical protein